MSFLHEEEMQRRLRAYEENKMTDERAMKILNPKHREHYESIDIVNEACRIGMEAICKVKELKAENAALRERLEAAEARLAELKGGKERG